MLDRTNPKPLYIQLRDIMVEKIETEKWQPNTKVPSENELAAMYGLSRMTVRSVITDLVKEGLLYRVQGKGTFVSERKIVTKSPYYSGVREQLERKGFEVETRVLEKGLVACAGSVASYLQMQEGELVYRLKRIRYIKKKPISLHISYVNPKYSEALEYADLESEQLCVILNREYGLQRKKCDEILESTLASQEEAVLLGMEKGNPLLLLRDILYNLENVPYEYTKILYRGDKVQLRFEYE